MLGSSWWAHQGILGADPGVWGSAREAGRVSGKQSGWQALIAWRLRPSLWLALQRAVWAFIPL